MDHVKPSKSIAVQDTTVEETVVSSYPMPVFLEQAHFDAPVQKDLLEVVVNLEYPYPQRHISNLVYLELKK
jgi:hypothetical protein